MYPEWCHHSLSKTRQDASKNGLNNTAAAQQQPHLEDHWASRPTQQRALLLRLFQWKAESGGREIVLLAGAGLAEGCVAAETRLEYKLPLLHPPPPSESEEKREHGARGASKTGKGKGAGGEKGEENQEEDEKKPKKTERRLIGIEQVGALVEGEEACSGRAVAYGIGILRSSLSELPSKGRNTSEQPTLGKHRQKGHWRPTSNTNSVWTAPSWLALTNFDKASSTKSNQPEKDDPRT